MRAGWFIADARAWPLRAAPRTPTRYGLSAGVHPVSGALIVLVCGSTSWPLAQPLPHRLRDCAFQALGPVRHRCRTLGCAACGVPKRSPSRPLEETSSGLVPGCSRDTTKQSPPPVPKKNPIQALLGTRGGPLHARDQDNTAGVLDSVQYRSLIRTPLVPSCRRDRISTRDVPGQCRCMGSAWVLMVYRRSTIVI